jgi:hypothetical protein
MSRGRGHEGGRPLPEGAKVGYPLPIVFSVGSDPVAAGLVENFRKPGGKFTDTYNQATDLLAKGLPCPVRQS